MNDHIQFLDGHLADAPFLAIARQVVFLAVLVYPPADRIGPYSEFLGYLICGGGPYFRITLTVLFIL